MAKNGKTPRGSWVKNGKMIGFEYKYGSSLKEMQDYSFKF